MPSDFSFTGAAFVLDSASYQALSTVRVKFNNIPQASDPAGANDALNPGNYSLSGPGVGLVASVAPVSGDPLSFDLTTTAPLGLGSWILTASASLETPLALTLGNPRSWSFPVSLLPTIPDVADGALQDNAETILRKHLPLSLSGRAWSALIAALAIGDQINWDNTVLAFNQLFKSTARGIYLDRKSGDDGLDRPPNIGMSDDLFRQLSIKTTTSKLTQEVLLEIMEIFYGSDATRASSVTALAEPFNLVDGDSLEVLLDEKTPITISFRATDFTRIGFATAVEVADALTRGFRKFNSKAWAVAFQDSNNANRVKIYSESLGLNSGIRVTGGHAQLGLQFPALLTTYSGSVSSGDGYNWTVTSPAPGLNRIQLSNSGGTSKVDLTTVQTGDYVVFQAVNSTVPAGVYPILAVSVSFSGSALVQSFDLAGNTGNSTFLQLNNQEMTFFRPVRTGIHQAGERTVVIAQAGSGLEVQVPATTQAVNRTVKTASYLHDTLPLTVSSLQRLGSTVTVTTGVAHGLTTGASILVEAVNGGTVAPALTVGSPASTGLPGSSDASLATIWTSTRVQDVQSTANHVALSLLDGRLLISGGRWNNGGPDTAILNCELFEITSTSTIGSGASQYGYNWITAGSMATARYNHAGSLLTDINHTGFGLITGGTTDGTTALASIEIYSVVANNPGFWTTRASMSTARMRHAQVTLQSQKVLVIGGVSAGVTTSTCELYTVSTNTWAAAGALINARADAAAVVLNDGRVLVVGGKPTSGATSGYRSSCELYDPTGNTWSLAGRMAYSRAGHTATVLPDGRVLVTGGSGASTSLPGATPVPLTQAEIFDPVTNRWAPAGQMSAGRTGHGAVYLSAKDRVLVAGGGVQAAEYFDVKTFTWRFVPNTPVSAQFGTLDTTLSYVNGTDMALLHGGFTGAGATTHAFLFQGAEDVFANGGLDGVFEVTVVSPTVFTYTTPNYTGLTLNQSQNTVIRPMAAVAAGSVPGPFLLDPQAGLAITNIETEVTMDLAQGQQYGTLDVADATSFPDAPGWLVIGFGTEESVSPIRYLGRFSATALTLDYGFKFTATNRVKALTISQAQRGMDVTTLTLNLGAGISDSGLAVGQVVYFKSTDANFSFGYKTITARTANTISFSDTGADTVDPEPGLLVISGPKITLLTQKGVFVPTNPETLGVSYITASSAGLTAAIQTLEDNVGAGLTVDTTVIYPSDRGLGGEGLPASGGPRLSDKIEVWGGDSLDTDLATARGES